MDRVDVLSRCILESTKFMEPIDAITIVWRLECSLSKEEIPFYTGSSSLYVVTKVQGLCHKPTRLKEQWEIRAA